MKYERWLRWAFYAVAATVIVYGVLLIAPRFVGGAPTDAFNCTDFATQRAAQVVYVQARVDVNRLDRDQDGLARESLP